MGIDEATGEMVAAVATSNDLGDGQLLPELLDQIDADLVQVSGDGAYDMGECSAQISAHKAQAAMPPRRGARIWRHGHSNDPPLARDESLRSIRRTGRGVWERAIGYHRRNKAETAIFGMKTLFGDRVYSRGFEAQAAEIFIRCSALNHLTRLGIPDSYAV